MFDSKDKVLKVLACTHIGLCSVLLIDNPKLMDDMAIGLMPSAVAIIFSEKINR
ncbi:hypothetical protein NDI49_29510 [Trichocoleus sp. ST-U3]|jgi:hypothetical protein